MCPKQTRSLGRAPNRKNRVGTGPVLFLIFRSHSFRLVRKLFFIRLVRIDTSRSLYLSSSSFSKIDDDPFNSSDLETKAGGSAIPLNVSKQDS
jgi:hypothetical protein